MLQHLEKDFEIATPFKNSLLISFFRFFYTGLKQLAFWLFISPDNGVVAVVVVLWGTPLSSGLLITPSIKNKIIKICAQSYKMQQQFFQWAKIFQKDKVKHTLG